MIIRKQINKKYYLKLTMHLNIPQLKKFLNTDPNIPSLQNAQGINKFYYYIHNQIIMSIKFVVRKK